jgi:hypothetical protein
MKQNSCENFINDHKHKIICHISGLNEHYKNKIIMFINKISHIITILDLDDVTETIINDEQVTKLDEKYDEYKLNYNPQIKQVEEEIKQYWYDKLTSHIEEFLGKTEQKVVILGSTVHYKFATKKIDLDVDTKFFLDISYDKYTKQIIRENLDKYKNDIINGIFPLDYLNGSFLMKKRLNTQKIYQKTNYKVVKWEELINFLNPSKKNKEFWHASFDKDVPKKIKIFNQPWIALANLIDKDINISIINGQPHIHEKKELILQTLKKKGYLYQIESDNIMINKSNHHKFKVSQPYNIVKEIPVDNIFKKLASYNVKFVYYGISNER